MWLEMASSDQTGKSKVLSWLFTEFYDKERGPEVVSNKLGVWLGDINSFYQLNTL